MNKTYHWAYLLSILLLLYPVLLHSDETDGRQRYNFNPQWLLRVGDFPGAERPDYDDRDWKKISLPHAFNEDEAFKVSIAQMTDTVAWYRKHFRLPASARKESVHRV